MTPPALSFGPARPSLLDDTRTVRKLELNLDRNRKQDQTATIDAAAAAFRYEDCRDAPWNPEPYSFLWGTALWDGATARQRVLLNQLYWVAYYSQIVSAEVATIYFNQTSAAGLYQVEDFRLVCDTLDLESAQERAHIHAFKKVSEAVERELFGERLFTWPMRGPFDETMVHADTDRFLRAWKSLQLRTFGLLSSGNAFIACQYFTIRGIRTLAGKLVQHQLSRHHADAPDPAASPIPSQISYSHFLDESYHFNSSTILSHDVVRSLKPPTPFERWVVDLALRGCQRDHRHFSVAINGIFWYDPALYPLVYRLLRTPHFGFDDAGARDMMRRCFTEESPGLQAAHETHRTACQSYRAYLDGMQHVSGPNREMALMSQASVAAALDTNRRALERFVPPAMLPARTA